MNVNTLHVAVAGLAANAAQAAVSAHNIANINTDGFKKSRATIEAGAAGIPEVKITETDTPGPMVFNPEGLPGGDKFRELSNVDMVEEFVKMRIAKHGYSANISVIRVQNEMIGTILDIII